MAALWRGARRGMPELRDPPPTTTAGRQKAGPGDVCHPYTYMEQQHQGAHHHQPANLESPAGHRHQWLPAISTSRWPLPPPSTGLPPSSTGLPHPSTGLPHPSAGPPNAVWPRGSQSLPRNRHAPTPSAGPPNAVCQEGRNRSLPCSRHPRMVSATGHGRQLTVGLVG